MNFEIKYPGLEEMKFICNKISKTSFPTFSGENLELYLKEGRDILTKDTGAFPLILKPVGNPEILQDFPLYRVRIFEEIKDTTKISEYSCPPKATKNGRGNLIGHPVFYASDFPLTSICESLKDFKPTTIALSKWEFQTEKIDNLLIAPFIPEELIDKNPFSILSKFTIEDYRKICNYEVSDVQIMGMKYYINFLAKQFLSDDEYSISSFISFNYLYNNPPEIKFPILLIYASNQAEQYGVNFALHPNSVEFLRLSYVYKIEINSIEKKENEGILFKYSVCDDFGVNVNNKIKWGKISNNKELCSDLYMKDFKQNLDFDNCDE